MKSKIFKLKVITKNGTFDYPGLFTEEEDSDNSRLIVNLGYGTQEYYPMCNIIKIEMKGNDE